MVSGNLTRRNTGDRVLDSLIVSTVIISVILSALPFIYIIAISLSSKDPILSGRVALWPVGFTLEAYTSILKTNSILYSLIYSVILTVVYTVLSMFMTICAAYPLTKDRLKGRSVFFFIIIITMYFGGGIIPEYILMKQLQLTNTVWVLILPGLISAFNLIILKSFFQSLPANLEESAYIDGATDIGILTRIALPLSTPVLATLTLFYAVGRWNGFQDALIYITKPELYPIQLKLYQIIYNASSSEVMQEGVAQTNMVSDSIIAACIVFATLPIVLLYPKLQKFFVSGVMLGAVKG